MEFDEIPAGSKIIMNISNGGEMQARFLSKVIKNTGSGILVIPFVHKGKRVNFIGSNVQIHMDAQLKTGETYTFKSCKIITVRKDGLLFHKITSSMKNGIENRREEHRCYVGEHELFSFETVPDQITTTLRDVSSSGFSFTLSRGRGIDLMPGVVVTCSFKDHKGKVIQIQGKVIRTERMDDYILYGCRCAEPNAEVSEYVKYIEDKTIVTSDSMVQV